MSLATAGIHCTISPPLSDVMEDCSIVRVQQLQMLYRRRCSMSTSQCMFGSLWNVVVAQEHRCWSACSSSLGAWPDVFWLFQCTAGDAECSAWLATWSTADVRPCHVVVCRWSVSNASCSTGVACMACTMLFSTSFQNTTPSCVRSRRAQDTGMCWPVDVSRDRT